MPADSGRFVLVRSDHLRIVIDKPNVPYALGRGRDLPAFQQLQAAYVSREHLTATWMPPSLFISQKGKNPTFFDPACHSVPLAGTGTLEVRADETIAAPALRTEADGHPLVTVPLWDPIAVAAAPPLTQRDAATLYFPAEAGLPCIAIRCERTVGGAAETRDGSTAANSSLTAAQMLSVPKTGLPAAGTHDDDEDDEDDGGGKAPPGQGRASTGAGAEAAPKARWEGLLDAAMQEHHRGEVAGATGVGPEVVQSPTPSPATRPPAPARAPPPSPAAPATAPTTTATTTTPASATATSARPVDGLGLWEWKCHAKAPDADPKSWRRYPLAVAQVLETAYRAGQVVVDVPDRLLGIKGGAVAGGGTKRGRTADAKTADAQEPCSYGVCLSEASLDGAMIQFQKGDPGKFRLVRRTGGCVVDRAAVKPMHIIPESSTDSSSSDYDDSDSDSSTESSLTESESESVSSSDSEEERRPRKKRVRK